MMVPDNGANTLKKSMNANGLEPMVAVYCYFFPEVRPLMREVAQAFPESAYLVTGDSRRVNDALKGIFCPDIELPSTSRGTISLDDMHVPVIERLRHHYAPHVSGMGDFSFAYPTSGSSEGIFKSLVKMRNDGLRSIAVLDGEYEGYEIYAKEIGLDVERHRFLDPTLAPRRWFISNPSARDGNIIPDTDILALCDAGHTVALDLAYVGSTAPHQFNATHENIDTLFLSLSKPYGLFRFRVGVTFSRDEVTSLYGNKWFKDPLRLLQGLKVVETFPPCTLHAVYHATQLSSVDDLRHHGITARPSDALLLANTRDGEGATMDIERYRRGDAYRFCLTPYFERKELYMQGGVTWDI